MAFEDLIAGIAKFQKTEHANNAKHYQALAMGQSPDTFVIACADSRLTPQAMTQSESGEMFLARNAGNFVPKYPDGMNEGTAATLEYAILGLGVTNIVILGHSDCGAMKALKNGASENLPHVKRWIVHGNDALSAAGPDCDLLSLTLENIRSQINNLMTYDFVAARIKNKSLTLHGWYFDIGSGTVDAIGHDGKFAPISEIYAT